MVIKDKEERRKNQFLKRYNSPLSLVGDVTSKKIYEGYSDKVVGFTLHDFEALNGMMSNTHLEIWEAFKSLERKGYVKHGQRPADTTIFLIFLRDDALFSCYRGRGKGN